ncbi:hypothetical protein MKZ38_002433 [Zalerion maritima]|uniref:Response regulatory domain-containing protein n=1 Tax=Zalerion maritima TaxID=339359 RepID=A0AAD5RPY2_9PEZI|nr:hypothetical protein MKZ38_002433 [Zalerion maritima]
MGDLTARFKAKFSKKPRSIASSANSVSSPTAEHPPSLPHFSHHNNKSPNHLSTSSRITFERNQSFTGTPSTRNGSLNAVSRRQSSAVESTNLPEQGKAAAHAEDGIADDSSDTAPPSAAGTRRTSTRDSERAGAGAGAQSQNQQLHPLAAGTTLDPAQQTPSTAGTSAAPTPNTSESSSQLPNNLYNSQQAAAAPATSKNTPAGSAPSTSGSHEVRSSHAGAGSTTAATTLGLGNNQNSSSSRPGSNNHNHHPTTNFSSINSTTTSTYSPTPTATNRDFNYGCSTAATPSAGAASGFLGNTSTNPTSAATNLDSIDENRIIVTTAPAAPTAPTTPSHQQYPRAAAPTSPGTVFPCSMSTGGERKQSLIPIKQTELIKTLLPPTGTSANEESSVEELAPITKNMVTRKIWVKRASGGSATLVTINEDDLVDDVRDTILRKYQNSLGRQFDAPDLNIHLVTRDHHNSPRKAPQARLLGPEEPMAQTLDKYYLGGQAVEDALIIEVIPSALQPPTPVSVPLNYMTSMPANGILHDRRSTPRLSPSIPVPNPQANDATSGYFDGVHHPRAEMQPLANIGSNGQQMPSPGAPRGELPEGRRRGERPPQRQRFSRTQTSPTHPHVDGSTPNSTVNGAAPASAGGPRPLVIPRPSHSRTHSGVSEQPPGTPSQARANSGPGNNSAGGSQPPPARTSTGSHVTTPPVRVQSPRPKPPKKTRKLTKDEDISPPLPAPPGSLKTSIPPINVLIVEDNLINLKLLEAFIKRLKVRWQTAVNGAQAVKKWRTGGFHLVLMDIQLPVMTGLQATREIRRLEKANSIGVFTSSASSAPEAVSDDIDPKDRIDNLRAFKSPVIIVALTASSLQSDRHEALAAGCNDFLTKPVNFVWLERKVMEWGCMQALIDFAGWRQWKHISEEREKKEAARKKAEEEARYIKRQQKQSLEDRTGSNGMEGGKKTEAGDVDNREKA